MALRTSHRADRLVLKIEDAKRWFAVALIAAFAVWGVCAGLDVGKQRKLMFRGGTELLTDFWMPRTVASSGYDISDADREASDRVLGGASGRVDGRMVVAQYDRCYPALPVVLVKLFPATWTGAVLWTCLGAAVFALALWVVMASAGCRNRTLFAALMLGMPVLFNFERANPIWLSAAAIGIFLAWWDDETKWKRYAAAVCLAVATVLKISPGALGLLYLLGPSRNAAVGAGFWRGWIRYWKEIGVCALAAVLLFVVPWLFVPGGFSAIPRMFENAAANSAAYAHGAVFGLIGYWRMARVALHLDCSHLWSGGIFVVRLSQTLGLAALVWGARRRNYVLLIGGLLLAAGNMHYYGALYLYPVFILTPPRRRLEILLWFVVFCPLQLVFGIHSANAQICNTALLALMALHLLYCSRGTQTP